ncbi:MAG: nuclear transport factor 2 family protein [Microthrixaceae bacterium]
MTEATPVPRTDGKAEPFVALMRRYCIDYTCSHDLSVCDEIMVPGYTLHMGEHHLAGRDEAYKPAVLAQLRQFPFLGLVVHDIVTNGDRLALRFSEHGASVKHAGRMASWSGIGVYCWDGSRLTENYVEQDYLSRRNQLDSGDPLDLVPPALDPWVTTAQPEDAATEAVVRAWLELASFDAADMRVDDSWRTGSPQPRFDDMTVRVDDIFTAGSRAAFHATLTGTYVGGLAGLEEHIGRSVEHYVVGIVTVGDHGLGGDIVTDRLGLVRRLARSA